MSSNSILLLSGPNLDRLGTREPEIYGSETLDQIEVRAISIAESLGLKLTAFQSGAESELISKIHAATDDGTAGIIINPGAFTHYAWGIHDALAAFGSPVIELHLSNPATREPWRHQSVVTPVATGLISGLGSYGYEAALLSMKSLLETS